MRPMSPHAAESGVGKHTARESERVQACATGKERVTHAHPHKLASEASKASGAFLFLEIDAAVGSWRRTSPFRRGIPPRSPLREKRDSTKSFAPMVPLLTKRATLRCGRQAARRKLHGLPYSGFVAATAVSVALLP